ncbi:MAG: cobyric acid synthase [Ruminococcus sp.]
MRAKSIMVVGTMSSAGKSFITAGLCRIFRQDGLRTVPFKSQNMALNSYITRDGLEMGRAQVMQAEAAGVEPDVRMNPILLKPTSDSGSQVIVNGEVFGTMGAVAYYTKKEELIPHIMKAYDSLAAENDVIVLEGAGSPAEINLKDVDIVNMGMAKLSDSPVILVGDIDRGGVFASVYGTIMLMDEEERSRIQGIIINKFRGDVEILKPGLTMLEELTGVPVLGVVPYAQLDLNDEDSLSDRLTHRTVQTGAKLDLAVIRVPRISNFTDFEVFERIDGVSVRYVTRVQELGSPDVIFLPGTKNTMADLRWMRQNGLEAAILKQHERGSLVIGICGGFQMLGKTLSDPDGVEDGGSMRGMGLLDTETVFLPQKRRTRMNGTIASVDGVLEPLSGHAVSGYEIHMGETRGLGNAVPFTTLETGETDGYRDPAGTVFGSYLHGIFDSPETAQKLVQALLMRKGEDTSTMEAFDLDAYKEEQYDKLADTLRESLDMQRIYDILNQWGERT